MIRNYLTSAWRNITRHKFTSFINIFSLTVGLTCCLVILTYIINELSYDKYNANADRTYRVTRIFYTSDKTESLHLGAVAPPFGPLLKNAFPEVEKMTRVLNAGNAIIRYNDKIFNEDNLVFADESFMDVFTVNVVKGSPQNALTEPFCIMLTEDVAKKYFGDVDPINKMVTLDNDRSFKVTGIFKAFPNNSHMHPKVMVSFSTLNDNAIYGAEQLRTNFGNNAFFTYLLLPKKYDIQRLVSRLPQFLNRDVHLGYGNKTTDVTALTIQKLTDIHLRSHLDDEVEENGDIKRVYIFSVIAIFILLIACINYMNLATARSTMRAREIGIRKVIGAQRPEIIRQFLSESVLITYVALLFAIAFTAVLLPSINKLSDLNLSFTGLLSWNIIMPVLLLPFAIGLLSGIYPAIFMSSFIPVKVLKGVLKVGSGSISFRKVLVVTQFSISIVLIVATTVVFQQLGYMQKKSLGFNKEHIITMGYNSALNPQYESFRSELLKNAGVTNVGRSSRIPSGRLLDNQGASIVRNGKLEPLSVDLKMLSTDYGFIPTYDIKMAAGRNFSPAFATDTNNYIINETAVKAIGWKNADEAIGKDMAYGGVNGKIVGVVNDFHFESLHQKIIPLIFVLPSPHNGNYRRLSVKIGAGNLTTALSSIEATWNKYLPEVPFEYTFLDERFQRLYKSEQQQGNLFTIFSCIAIFIACLGLFGLSAFIISQRVKEIGIRKVLGASIPQIVMELSKDFLKLVLVAAVIALPIAWFSMNRWLLDFAFRITISWWILALAGVVAFIIAFVTISLQSIKAALANPVKSLKSE